MALNLLASNNASTVLAAAINATATTLTVNSGTGALFPVPVSGTSFFKLTLLDAATGTITEIVHVTDRTGDVMTIQRAQEGTVARAWSANDIAANMMTAGTLSYILGNFQPLDATLTALAGLATGANKLPYFTGTDAAGQTDLTQVGRDIIGKSTTADILTYLGLGTASKKDWGTGSGQLPDMSTFTLSALSASSGYQKLPSGLILQWTIGPSTTTEGITTVSLPISFPNAIFSAFVSTNALSGNQSDIMYQTSGSTRSSITLQAQIFTTAAAAGSVSPVIFAIGF